MKKFSISTQLLILVFTILLFTSAIFMVATYFTAYRAAQQQVYVRLDMYLSFREISQGRKRSDKPDGEFPGPPSEETTEEETGDATTVSTTISYEIVYTSMAETEVPPNDHGGPQDMDIYAYIVKDDGTIINDNVLKFNSYFNKKDANEFSDLITSIKNHALDSGNTDYEEYNKITTDGGAQIYYLCLYHVDTNSYTFVYTNTDYSRGFIIRTFLTSFIIFLGMLVLAIAVFYGWSAAITRRLRVIQNHLIDLPKNKYEKSYVDTAGDEIGELSKSVEVMREEIGKNEKTKQEMLQNLSHDFKTPIAVIKSYAEAYQDGMAGDDAINTIIEQAELLKRKVNRLLQYNSLEYLTKDKPFEDVNMTELVKSVVNNYKFQTDLKFTLVLDENIIFEGYHENWSTVVENIIDNAKRYAKSEIKIVLKPNRLRIFNDGEPIDEQFLNSVFKPYEKGSKGQFGLGMSIVMKTANFFGFAMNVRNEDNGGVSFIIEKKE